MPSKSSLAAPAPRDTLSYVSTESTGVLSKRVASAGLCTPAAQGMAKTAFTVAGDDDPWFPTDETGDKAIAAAHTACLGCAVKTECLILALRDEVKRGGVHGVRGGRSAGERIEMVRELRRVQAAQAGVA